MRDAIPRAGNLEMGTTDIDDQNSHDGALRATAATSPGCEWPVAREWRQGRGTVSLVYGARRVNLECTTTLSHQPQFMRVLLQRVSRATVRVDGRVTGQIERGYLLLVGLTHDDTAARLTWMADKIVGLRLFPDSDDKMNLALADVGGSVLVVSQFTLYGDATRGRRPSFIAAARPEVAIPLYEQFITMLRDRGVVVATGEFGAMMQVELINDGPVTLPLEC